MNCLISYGSSIRRYIAAHLNTATDHYRCSLHIYTVADDAASVAVGEASAANGGVAFGCRALIAVLGFAGPLYPWKDLPAGTAAFKSAVNQMIWQRSFVLRFSCKAKRISYDFHNAVYNAHFLQQPCDSLGRLRARPNPIFHSFSVPLDTLDEMPCELLAFIEQTPLVFGNIWYPPRDGIVDPYSL